MAIITKPIGGIFKGVPATITLNKSELLALASVSADSYFSVTTNWNKVILSYKSFDGNQQEIVEFNATLSSPTGFFDVSLTARNFFEIQVIKIIDFDGGIFIVPRSELVIVDFDVIFVTPPSSLSYTTPVIYTQNETITNNVPSVIGTVNSYSISPALPTGLTINPTTGVISGTPTVAVAAANYTVTASNSGGPTTAIVNITVESAEVPVTGDYFTYTYNPDNLTISSTGGVSGGPQNSLGVESTEDSLVGDFSIQFKFNWDSFTQAQGNGGDNTTSVFLGIRSGLINNGIISGISVSEFTSDGSNKNIRFWATGTSNTLYTLPAGDHSFMLVKEGDDLKYYIDGVLRHQVTVFTLPTNYPVVRTKGFVACTESREVEFVTWNVAGKTGAGTVTAGANGLITKSAGGAGYNVNVLSNETITGDGYVEFVISASFINVVFGLAEVNSPTGSFNNLITGCYRTTNPGALEGVVTTGNLTVNFGNFLNIGSTQNGDVIKIARVGTTYSIQINNGVIYSATINNTNPLKASVTIYGETFGVNNVTIAS